MQAAPGCNGGESEFGGRLGDTQPLVGHEHEQRKVPRREAAKRGEQPWFKGRHEAVVLVLFVNPGHGLGPWEETKQISISSGLPGEVPCSVRRRNEQPGEDRPVDEPNDFTAAPKLEERSCGDVLSIMEGTGQVVSVSIDAVAVPSEERSERVAVPVETSTPQRFVGDSSSHTPECHSTRLVLHSFNDANDRAPFAGLSWVSRPSTSFLLSK